MTKSIIIGPWNWPRPKKPIPRPVNCITWWLVRDAFEREGSTMHREALALHLMSHRAYRKLSAMVLDRTVISFE